MRRTERERVLTFPREKARGPSSVPGERIPFEAAEIEGILDQPSARAGRPAADIGIVRAGKARVGDLPSI